jgi:hypothetical protein
MDNTSEVTQEQKNDNARQWDSIAHLVESFYANTGSNQKKWQIITEALSYVRIKGYSTLTEQYDGYYLINQCLDMLASQNGRGTHESMLNFLKMVIKHHSEAIFEKNWYNYFAQTYQQGSFSAIDQVVESYNYYHTILYKALNRNWEDIATLLLPMLQTMQSRGRAWLATTFIEKNFIKGLNFYYSLSGDRSFAIQKQILQSVFASGNMESFMIVINRENLNNKNGADYFKENENPLLWAIRHRRYLMFKYLVENQENKQLIFGYSDQHQLHPVYEAAKLDDFKYFKLALDNYLPELQKDEFTGKVLASENDILLFAAFELVQRDDLKALQYLIENGLNHQDDENIIFMKACCSGSLDCMNYLHSLGVTLNPQGEYSHTFWSMYCVSLQAIYFLEKHQLAPEVSFSQILNNQIVNITEYECLQYCLDNASDTELREALEVLGQSENLNKEYYIAALKENRSRVLHRIIDMQLNDYFDESENESEQVSKI